MAGGAGGCMASWSARVMRCIVEGLLWRWSRLWRSHARRSEPRYVAVWMAWDATCLSAAEHCFAWAHGAARLGRRGSARRRRTRCMVRGRGASGPQRSLCFARMLTPKCTAWWALSARLPPRGEPGMTRGSAEAVAPRLRPLGQRVADYRHRHDETVGLKLARVGPTEL